jgi:hypothetical protein
VPSESPPAGAFCLLSHSLPLKYGLSLLCFPPVHSASYWFNQRHRFSHSLCPWTPFLGATYSLHCFHFTPAGSLMCQFWSPPPPQYTYHFSPPLTCSSTPKMGIAYHPKQCSHDNLTSHEILCVYCEEGTGFLSIILMNVLRK